MKDLAALGAGLKEAGRRPGDKEADVLASRKGVAREFSVLRSRARKEFP